ncbi:hypothetical protein [Bordetella genomosp. 9]|nr:hypothetical protein [Bordetella genomosp. 9]
MTTPRGRDWIVPHDMRMRRETYIDADGAVRRRSGRISETETVWHAMQILCAADEAPVPDGGDQPIAAYLNIAIEAVGNPIFPVPAGFDLFRAGHEAKGKAALEEQLAILDRSPTFRRLIRLARHTCRLGVDPQHRWTVRVVPPAGYREGLAVYTRPYVRDDEARVLTVPAQDSPPMAGQYYLTEWGPVMALGPGCAIVQAVIAMLAGLPLPEHVAWKGPDGGVEPQRLMELGAGERGAIGYLAQRVVREIFPVARPWLTSLPFGDTNLLAPADPVSAVAQLNPETMGALVTLGGVAALKRYMDWQDAFIEGRYPLEPAAPNPAAGGSATAPD